MLAIKRSDVPSYLKSGSFYQNLDVEDDEAFEVPMECLKDDPSVETEGELVHLLQTVRYWGLHVHPVEIFEFILDIGESGEYQGLYSLFPELAPHLGSILKVKEAPPSDRIAAAIKARLGVSVLYVFRQKGYEWNETTCESAARMNDLECLMYLQTEGCPWNENTILAAAEHNSVQCLQYALDFGGFDIAGLSEAMNTAARHGNIDCMRLLHKAGVAWDVRTVVEAILANQLDTVRFLHTQGCELPTNSCWWVVWFHGSIEVLRYLHQEAGADLAGTLLTAAEVGNLDCLQYAHEQGEPWNPNVCVLAARGGHLHCLRYANQHGCPWDDNTAQAAISARSWECLKYSLRHGRGWWVHICMSPSLYYIFHIYTEYISSGSIAKFSFNWWKVILGICLYMCLLLVVLYRKHFGRYLSVRNADRIVQSSFCLAFMFLAGDGILEASWPMAALRGVVIVVFAGFAVLFNMQHVVFQALPADSPHWFQFHH